MSLSELMSNADLAMWPQVGLVLFMAIFTGVLIKTFAKSQQDKHEEARFLPLTDDVATRAGKKVNGHG